MPSSDTQFQPGQAKPENSGRKAGTPNRQAEEIKAQLADAILDQLPALTKQIKFLGEATYWDYRVDFVKIMIRLLALTVPRGANGLEKTSAETTAAEVPMPGMFVLPEAYMVNGMSPFLAASLAARAAQENETNGSDAMPPLPPSA